MTTAGNSSQVSAKRGEPAHQIDEPVERPPPEDRRVIEHGGDRKPHRRENQHREAETQRRDPLQRRRPQHQNRADQGGEHRAAF